MIQDRIALLEVELEKVTAEAANLYFQSAIIGKDDLREDYYKKRDELIKLEANLRLARHWLATNGK